MKTARVYQLLSLTLFLLLLIAAGFIFSRGSGESSQSADMAIGKYPYINTSVVSGLDKHYIINFLPLRKELKAISDSYSQKTFVYFVYLNNASWIGINERTLFYAASTTKVPLAMAAFKAVEDGRLSLEEEYALESLDLNDDFGDLYKDGADATFTVEKLLKIMLEKSDDTAATALFHIFNKIGVASPLDGVYGDMGWEFGDIGAEINFDNINLKTLSNMFNALYNASYIDIQHSQFILEELTRTPFNNGIVAGVPKDIKVSHKVGIADQYKAYSDCGIVYAPQRSYLLCVGSEGADKAIAERFMSEISTAAYNYVINN